MTISDAFEVKTAVSLSKDDLNGHILKLKTKTEDLIAIADSGSPMSFLNKKRLADYVKTTNQQFSNTPHRRTPRKIWRAAMVKP